MQSSPKVIKCKYCGADLIYNTEIRAFCNWGGENDGLIHKDKRTGNTIESTSTDVKRILEEVVMLRSEIDRLRSSVWEAHQKVDDINKKVTR